MLSAAGKNALDQAEVLCNADLGHALAHMTPADFFTAPLRSLPGAAEALGAYLNTPVDGYDRPILLAGGEMDRDVPPQTTMALYDQLTEHQQNVTIHIYPGQDHGGTLFASMPDATDFLARNLSQ